MSSEVPNQPAQPVPSRLTLDDVEREQAAALRDALQRQLHLNGLYAQAVAALRAENMKLHGVVINQADELRRLKGTSGGKEVAGE